MRFGKKIAILVAVLCVGVGLLLVLGAMVATGFDFGRMNTLHFVTNTYTVHDTFTNISIKDAECDVRLVLTEGGTCTVECRESDKIYNTVAVENGTLTVRRVDSRRWYEHIGVYWWGKMEVTVYLPQAEYHSLSAVSVSGNVEIPEGFSFQKAEARSTSGSVRFAAAVEGDLYVKTVSGSVSVEGAAPKTLTAQSTSGSVSIVNVCVGGPLNAKTVSGRLTLTDVTCQSMEAESTSGGIVFSDTLASGHMRIKSVSGAVELRRCDADTLWIKTTSGSVRGTLLTEKIFVTNTSSGRVNVPQSASGGKCEVKTTSGSIEFKIG